MMISFVMFLGVVCAINGIATSWAVPRVSEGVADWKGELMSVVQFATGIITIFGAMALRKAGLI